MIWHSLTADDRRELLTLLGGLAPRTSWDLSTLICGIFSACLREPTGPHARSAVLSFLQRQAFLRQASVTRMPDWCAFARGKGYMSFYATLTTPWGLAEVTGDQQGIEVSLVDENEVAGTILVR